MDGIKIPASLYKYLQTKGNPQEVLKEIIEKELEQRKIISY